MHPSLDAVFTGSVPAPSFAPLEYIVTSAPEKTTVRNIQFLDMSGTVNSPNLVLMSLPARTPLIFVVALT